jgi:hypothetical protein
MSLPVETSNAPTMTASRNHVNSENNIMTIFIHLLIPPALNLNREQKRLWVSLGERSHDSKACPQIIA